MDRTDTVILVSADTDLTPPLDFILKNHKDKKVKVYSLFKPIYLLFMFPVLIILIFALSLRKGLIYMKYSIRDILE